MTESASASEAWWTVKREFPSGRVAYVFAILYGARLAVSEDACTTFFDDLW